MRDDFGSVTAMRIRTVRKEVGLTQGELGVRMGISHAAVSQYERGHRVPNAGTLSRIAIALGVSIGYLLGEPTLSELDDKKPAPEMARPYINRERLPSFENGEYAHFHEFVSALYGVLRNEVSVPEEFELIMDAKLTELRDFESKYAKLLDSFSKLSANSQQKILELIDYYAQRDAEE